MNPGMLHGLTSLPGHPRLWTGRTAPEVAPPKFTAIGMSERCNNTSPRNILALTYRRFGFVIASTIILIGTIASRTVSFLTSIETSLLSWRSNLVTPFAPGSKLGLSMSLWCEEYLGRIGATQPVKSPPTTTPQSSSPSPYTTLLAYRHYNQRSSVSTSFERGN